MIYKTNIKVRFQHCDPAGIVFFPRYFEMTNQVVEDWFEDALQLSFQELHSQMRVGVPTVRMECDFNRPSRIGDELAFSLWVEQLGNSSFTLRITAYHEGELRLSARPTLAYVQLGKDVRAKALPDQLRRAMSIYLLAAEPANS